jgi:hypothetical protein
VLVGLVERFDCFEAFEGDELGAGWQFVGCRGGCRAKVLMVGVSGGPLGGGLVADTA